MKLDSIKDCRITDLLSISSLPEPKCMEGYFAYKTPFRESHSPTLIVTERNTWCDTGMKDAEGHIIDFKGDIVDLVVALGLAKGHTDAMRYLVDFQQGRIPYVDVSGGLTCRDRMIAPPFSSKSTTDGQYEPQITIMGIRDRITDINLLKLLSDEGIHYDVANHFLKEATIVRNRYVRYIDNVLLLRTDIGSSLFFTPFETKFIGKAFRSSFYGPGPDSCTYFSHIFDFLRGLSLGMSFGREVIVTNHISCTPSALKYGQKFLQTAFYLRENLQSEALKQLINEILPGCETIKI